MRKLQTVALTVAIAVSAGSFCVSNAVPAAEVTADTATVPAAEVTEDTANTADTAAAQTAAGHKSSEGNLSYEDAIADLYARSSEISNSEILQIAAGMEPSASVAEASMGSDEADKLIAALKDYEQQKAAYLLDDTNSWINSEIKAQWDLQSDYSRLGFTDSQSLTTLIPGFTVTSCETGDQNGVETASVDIDEWITLGYKQKDAQQADAQQTDARQNDAQQADTQTSDPEAEEDVSAYRYYFTANLEQNKDGEWTVVSIENTEQNYAWLEGVEEQPQYTADAAQGVSDSTAQGVSDSAAPAQSGELTAAQNGTEGIASLKTYGAAKYSYSPDKAIAYADKWATSRNPKYRSYPGVDCANFVSQCLKAGGMPVNDKWYPASYAWVNCMGAISNFKKYGKFMKAKNNNVLRGNPVYYDWNGDGTYDHTSICVGKNSAGVPIIDAHTGDHYHAVWTLGSNGTRATIQLRGSGGGSTTTGSWKKVKGKWHYYGPDKKPVSGWLTYKDKQYFLLKDGRMVTGWKTINGAWYYFGKDGTMKIGWLKLGARRFFLQENGKMQTGWLKRGKKSYYLSSDGHAVTGWQTIGGHRYYFKDNGAMTVGISKIDGSRYYFDKSSGHLSFGWVTSGSKKYFFSPSAEGKAATGYWDINGTIFHFNEEGVLQN